jgi:hypothetical protein
MVEIFEQPLVGVVCLIVFHIQAVMDSPDHCVWQLGFQVVSSPNSSQRNFFDPFGTNICMPLLYYHCNVGLELRLFVTSGWNPDLYFSDFRFYYSTSRSNSIVTIPFVQAACSTSRRTTRISAVCDDQYFSTLAMLEEITDKAFKVYMTRKTQGWFRRWECPRPSDAAASPGPGAAPGGAGSDASAFPGTGSVGRRGSVRPHHGGGGDDQALSPTVDLETLPSGGRA